MDLIAAIRRLRGVVTVVDRSWFFRFFATLCLAGSERGDSAGCFVLAPLRKTVGIDQRVRKTSAVTLCEVRRVGPASQSEAKPPLEFVCWLVRRLCPTVALAYLRPPPPPPLPTSPVQRLAAVLVLLPPPPSKLPSASESCPPSSQSPSSTARSFPYPFIPLVVSSVQRSKRNIHSTHHTT